MARRKLQTARRTAALERWIVQPKRGAVLDRAGEPLALSWNPNPSMPGLTASKMRSNERSLAQILSLDFAEVRQNFS
jgi:hypothetical protein